MFSRFFDKKLSTEDIRQIESLANIVAQKYNLVVLNSLEEKIDQDGHDSIRLSYLVKTNESAKLANMNLELYKSIALSLSIEKIKTSFSAAFYEDL